MLRGPKNWRCFSLSPRERVGVRGNKAFKLSMQHTETEMPQSSYRATRYWPILGDEESGRAELCLATGSIGRALTLKSVRAASAPHPFDCGEGCEDQQHQRKPEPGNCPRFWSRLR